MKIKKLSKNLLIINKSSWKFDWFSSGLIFDFNKTVSNVIIKFKKKLDTRTYELGYIYHLDIYTDIFLE